PLLTASHRFPSIEVNGKRIQWVLDCQGQVALTGSQVWWSNDVWMVFQRLEDRFESALKDYNMKQACLILSGFPFQIKLNMFLQVTNRQAFYWLSQLWHRWDEQQRYCLANICDVQFFYSYQYLGNTPRLVISPLNHRSVPQPNPSFMSSSTLASTRTLILNPKSNPVKSSVPSQTGP
uniref:Uncharacterized protein n=1 Tax=Hucho hucho TaxID=62062 RepID=A0A4W5LEK0_9TELE